MTPVAAIAAPASGGPTLTIRGTPYPVLLPKLSDARLHLAAVIISLQVLGQVAFGFNLSIAQILISLGTCAVLEMSIAFRRQRVIMWPASAMLTGNGVAFVLRVPATRHGDWWSTQGWWIFAGTAAVSLLSKHVIRINGRHVFNPSNFGLVLCFLVLGSSRAEPLFFWWAPLSAWMVLALCIIVTGGLVILARLGLLGIAIAFWVSFAVGLGVLAATGHAMSARWHLGPLSGAAFWWTLVSSPEILVFLFFMITDPKTIPAGRRARLAYAVSIGLLAVLLIAPARSEFWSKVAVLGSLVIVCAAMPVLARLRRPRLAGRRVGLLAAAGLAAYVGALVVAGVPARSAAAVPVAAGAGPLPAIEILPSHGVSTALNRTTARAIAWDLVSSLGITPAKGDRVRVWLEPGPGQDPPLAVAELSSGGRLVTFKLKQAGARWAIDRSAGELQPVSQLPVGPPLPGFKLTSVGPQVGLDFQQGSFRFGVTGDTPAMMGGGVCWLDYNDDGWLDLFAVNNYTDSQYADWLDHGGPPTSRLFRNEHGKFVNVTSAAHAGLPTRGEGCVAADLNGDGYTDLFVTTATNDELLWNNGNGTFTEGARKAGIVSYGWHSGAAVADVNGDGRPDLFVAGYTDLNHPIQGSLEGFPGSYRGVRDELFINEGNRHFKDVGPQVGLDPKPYDHSLGAVFVDVNGDGRPDLYVANDENPNRLYLNEPGGKYGFHFVEVGKSFGVDDPNAGMGIAATDWNHDGRTDLFVTNSRGQGNAAYTTSGEAFANARPSFKPAFGTNSTGWGDSWVDLRNSGTLDLVVANGGIPVTNVAADAAPVEVLAPKGNRYVNAGLLRGIRVNGRGLAAADYDNDGRVDIAVGTVGGKLLLFRNTSKAGHWLEVNVAPFSPGAVVTLFDRSGRQVREVQAGSSYLSSEDPRVHFGLGKATVATELIVRYPDGTVKRLRNVRTDRILTIRK
jgi:Na+-translocating ferredoxin:NAD+ oxidoreductase RnfD subunit